MVINLAHKKRFPILRKPLILQYSIGATGFEPATSRDAMELKPLDFKGFPKGKIKR